MDEAGRRLYLVVVPQVPVFTPRTRGARLGASEELPGSVRGLLFEGEAVLAEALSAADTKEEWLQLCDHPIQRLNRAADGDSDGSDCESVATSDDSARFVKVENDGGRCLAGGVVLRRHVLGTCLRPVEPRDAVDPVDFRELPEEAKLWPKSVLERFRLTGQQPPWSSDPGTEALMLDEPSELQVEANLRTAALWLSRCAALVVVAGEGMAEVLELDSGARGGAAWPGLAELGRSLDQMMTTRCFREEPELAWDCWRHYLRRFRDAELHAGYRSALFGEPPLGTFVLSTAWDGLWAAAGAKVHEVCGSPQELRCCGAWPLPEAALEPGAAPPWCRCGQVALPGVRLLDEAPSAACSELEGFLARVRGELLVMELGCKPGSEGRRRAEALAGHGPPGCTTRLLRVQRRFCALPQALRSSGCGVPLRCREALKRVEALLPFTGLGSFIFQDSSGSGGAEVRAPKDGPLGFAFRKALAADSRRQEDVDVAQLMFKANSVLREHRVADVAPDNAVPEEMFFQERDATPPVVRVFVINFTFHQKNDLLQQRVSRVWSLVKDLVEVYSTEEYRKNFEAAPDRSAAAGVIREVQQRVLPCHGFSLSADPEDTEVLQRVTQMQGFLQSGRVDPGITPALEQSVQLSGYSRLLSKPMKAKAVPKAKGASLALALPGASLEDTWKHSHRPGKAVWVAATWNKFEPQEMKWDGSKFYHIFQVGAGGWESFQLLVDGRWEQCVYPSIPDGCPFVEYDLLGPNNRGHGKNWTVGRHPQDGARAGDKVRVQVAVNGQGLPRQVTWRKEVRKAR